MFQNLDHDATDLHWDPAPGRNAFGWDDGGPDPIWRITVAALQADVEHDRLPSLMIDDVTLRPASRCRFDASCEGWASATAASDGSRLTWVEGGRQRPDFIDDDGAVASLWVERG